MMEQAVVLDTQTGDERWKGSGKVVYCNELVVVTAREIFLEARHTQVRELEVQLRSYNRGIVIAKGQRATPGCGNRTYSPWPRKAFVGVEYWVGSTTTIGGWARGNT
jgi:hypothetical protein